MSRRVARLLAVVVVVCGAWATPRPVQAQQSAPARVRVVPPDCDGEAVDLREAVRLLGVELVGDDVETVVVIEDGLDPAQPQQDEESDGGRAEEDDEPADEIAHIHVVPVPCEADATRFEVVVDDAITRKRVRRVVDVSGLPSSARPRALALGVAELLRASWTELVRADEPRPAVAVDPRVLAWITTQAAPAAPAEEQPNDEPPAELSPPVDDPEPAPPDPSTHLFAAALLRAFPADGSSLLGGRAGVSVPLGVDLPLRIRIEGSVEYGRVRVTLGDVNVGLASGALALDVSSPPGGPLGIDIGPRLEVGYGWAVGTPADATDVGLEGSAAVVVLSAHAALRVALGGPWHATADLQVGHTLAGLDAQVDDRSTTGLSGAAMALAVGVGGAL